jgi:hypothetical protein
MEPVQSREIPAKVRILFLAANPKDTTPLRLGEEVRAIDGALQRAEFREQFDLEQQHAVRVGDLQETLLRYNPTIVHFSGHGSATNGIILEDPAGLGQTVSPLALSGLFRTLKGEIRCVVLNACYSDMQALAIAEHIECVVGMSRAIGDRAAIQFAEAFYRGLSYGKDVQSAFELGTGQVDLEGLGEEDTPRLLALRGNPGEIKFVASEP